MERRETLDGKERETMSEQAGRKEEHRLQRR